MIVVVGSPISRSAAAGGGVDGRAALTAVAAVRAGAAVQLVGKAGDDLPGDAALLALRQTGVGHAAVLRDPAVSTPVVEPRAEPRPDSRLGQAALADLDAEPEAGATGESAPEPAPAADQGPIPPSLEPADVDLALRYLGDVRAIIVAEPQPAPVVAVVAEAAEYLGAALIVVVDPGAAAGDAPSSALLLEAPRSDPDGALAGLLGELAAAIDRGATADAAFAEVSRRLGMTPG